MGKYELNIDKFISTCEKYNIRKETCFNIGLICCSAQMVECGHNPDEALKKATELIEKGETTENVLKEVLKMSGFDENQG